MDILALFLILILPGKAQSKQLNTYNTVLIQDLYLIPFYQVEKIPLYSQFDEWFLSGTEVVFCQMLCLHFLSAFIEMIVAFQMLNQSGGSMINPTESSCVILLYSQIEFAKIFLRYCTCIHQGIGLQFSSFVIFFFVLGGCLVLLTRKNWPHRINGKVFSLYQSLRNVSVAVLFL